MATPPNANRIKAMRSPLVRARGRGTARAGTAHWTAERVTAMALVPLTVWFVVSVVGFAGAEQPAIVAWAGRPVNAALLLALIAMSFHHIQLGLQVVYEDYFHGHLLRDALILATKGACLVLGLLASVAVLKMAFGTH